MKSIEIENECFKNVSELKLIGMKGLESVIVGENCFTKKKSDNESYGLYVKNCESLRELKIGNHSFEEYSVCAIESVGSLELIEVGSECFKNVNELKLIGMKMLKKVLIGENCFTKKKSDKNAYGLYVKNCELLRELKIGCYSFTNYSVCEIENVPSLEVIEIGGLDRWNRRDDQRGVFSHASKLELKSDCSRMRMMTRFPQIDFHSVW